MKCDTDGTFKKHIQNFSASVTFKNLNVSLEEHGIC